MKGKKLCQFYIEYEEITRNIRKFVKIFIAGVKTDTSSYIYPLPALFYYKVELFIVPKQYAIHNNIVEIILNLVGH